MLLDKGNEKSCICKNQGLWKQNHIENLKTSLSHKEMA